MNIYEHEDLLLKLFLTTQGFARFLFHVLALLDNSFPQYLIIWEFSHKQCHYFQKHMILQTILCLTVWVIFDESLNGASLRNTIICPWAIEFLLTNCSLINLICYLFKINIFLGYYKIFSEMYGFLFDRKWKLENLKLCCNSLGICLLN